MKKGTTKLTKDGIAAALVACRGNVRATAGALNVGPQCIYDMMKRFPELREVRDDARSQILDMAELVIENNIAAALRQQEELGGVADSSDARWYLAKIGRDRGFGDTTQVATADGSPLEILIRYADSGTDAS